MWIIIAWLSIPTAVSISFFSPSTAREFGQAGSLVVAFGIVALAITTWIKSEIEKHQLMHLIQKVREKAREESAFNLELIFMIQTTILKLGGLTDPKFKEQLERHIHRNKHDQLDIMSARLELTRTVDVISSDLLRKKVVATVIEVIVIFIGTIQWGYGDGIVKWYYF